MNKSDIYSSIKTLADEYMKKLKDKVDNRIEEMQKDDNSHYLIYSVLGISNEEGNIIDIYQNKGRFLYKYAGSFLEEAALLCFKYKFKNAKKVRIENTAGSRPKIFEIDCLANIIMQTAHGILLRVKRV